MSNYEQLPDHIPFRHKPQEFFETLKILSESNTDSYFYADRSGLKTVGLATMIFEKTIGFFGGKDHTSQANVEVALAKFLTYGHLQGYTKHEAFQPWLSKLKERTQGTHFTTNMAAILNLLEKNRGNIRDGLQGHLIGLCAQHGDNVNALGGKTKIKDSSHPDFGRTPFILADRALSKGEFDQAVQYGENAYILGESYDDVLSLFLRIGNKIPHRNDKLISRLKEFKGYTLDKGQDERALRFDRILKRMEPEASPEANSHILIRLARAAGALGCTQEALGYCEQAKLLGADVTYEKRDLYLTLHEKAIDERRPVEALNYYLLAIENGLPEDSKKLADLYVKAAEDLTHAEKAKTGWRVERHFGVAINYFEKAIAHYKKENVILDKLFDGNWVTTYLEALKCEGQTERGITMVTQFADSLSEFSREGKLIIDKEERIAHIKAKKGFIFKAIRLYDIAMHFDPKNGEHPFKMANLYDYLNFESETRETFSLFLKAANCDPTNKYYKIGVIVAGRSQNKHIPDWCIAGYSGLESQNIESWFTQSDRFQQGKVRPGGRLQPITD